jgi:hypothetical protein
MLELLLNPGSITQGQWMILGILFLLSLGILFFVYRTYLVIKESTQNKYKPNIGLSKTDNSQPSAGDTTKED